MATSACTRAGRLAFALVAALCAADSARANDFDQFQNARSAYDSANYELAVDLFRGVLASTSDGPLLIESRKYLAASYLFLGRKSDAELEMEKLLREDPQYVLDPLAFPREMHEVFEQVRSRLIDEQRKLKAERAQRDAEREAELALEAEQERARLRHLLELARTERVEHMHSRWIAALPFGIGQFQNGDDGLGLVLAVTETTLLAASTTAYILHQDLPEDPKPADRDTVQALEPVFRYTNQISMALFAVVAVTGIIEAQLRFKPSTSETRPRPLPPDLEGLELELGIGPNGIALGGRF